MSERDRAKAYKQAGIKGELAYLSGVPIEDCPYKDIEHNPYSNKTSWSLAPFWCLGWYAAKNEDAQKP